MHNFFRLFNHGKNLKKIIYFNKIVIKNHVDKKMLKWYWREIQYDMDDGEIFKNYIIKRRNNNQEKNSILNLFFPEKRNPHVELIPSENEYTYDSVLIWLYDGDHLEMFIDHLLEYNNFPPRNYKIVFFRAPINPITWDSSVFERSWFNIFDFPNASGQRDIRKKDIDKYNKDIHREIKDQYNIIGDYSQIFIGGFSQSGCMALYSTLTLKENLGGCISFNSFNFDFSPLDNSKKKVPLLTINGMQDEVVISRHARQSYANFFKLGFNMKLIEEPGLYHHFTRSGLCHANNLLVNKKL